MLINKDKINKIIIFTTLPQRYGHMRGVKHFEAFGNVTILRFYTPEHKNSFFRQIIGYLFFLIQSLISGIKYSNTFDSVFATSSRVGTAFLGYLISKFIKRPYFLDIRDVFSDNLQSLEFSKKWFGNYFIRLLMKVESVIIDQTKWLNFVSVGFYNYTHVNPPGKKIHLFTNGIDKIFLENRKISKKNKIIVKSSPLKIVYAGNMGFGQGLKSTIIPVSKHFNEKIQFQLIGDGSSVKLIKKEVKNLNILNVHIISPVNRDELLKYYNKADVLFLQLNDIPAFNNVLPSKIFDYGSFDKPILAGVAGVARQFLLENLPHSFIYNPGDYQKAIDLIQQILDGNYKLINNTEFIKKFDRNKIMDNLADSFITHAS